MPYLQDYEMKQLMVRFPKVELSYEKIIHKKVSTDYCIAIPYGKKYFAWFSYYKSQNTCFFLEITRDHNICDIFYIPCSFNPELSYNTLMYGTMDNNKRFFFVEDIFHYKNRDVSRYSTKEKLNLLKSIFENDINQISLTNNDIIMGLPMMRPNYNELYADIVNLPYNIYCIQFRSFKNNRSRLNYIHNVKPQRLAVFKVKAHVNDDIYKLFYYHRGEFVMHNVALVPTYESSVMMNSLFRNIRENIDLDALEESEDEEVFEDISPDKFVDLERAYFMECEYSYKFRKWIPLKLTKDHKTIQKKQLLEYEKK